MKNYYDKAYAFVIKNLIAVLLCGMVLIGLFAINQCNQANSVVPSVSMTSDNTNFRNNGFVGGVMLRAQYAWESERKMQYETNLIGVRKYYYTVGEHRFNYNTDTNEWVQVR